MTTPITIVAERSALVDRTQELLEEFADTFAAGHVIACVIRCRDALERAGVRAGMSTAATAMARARLLGLTSGPATRTVGTFAPVVPRAPDV